MEPLMFTYKPKLTPAYLILLLGVFGGGAVGYSLLSRLKGFGLGRMVVDVPFPILNILLGIAGVVALWYTERLLALRLVWRKPYATVLLDERGISFTVLRRGHARRITRAYRSIQRVRLSTEPEDKRGQQGGAFLSVQFTDGGSERFRTSYFDSAAAFSTFTKCLRQQVAEARDGVV